MTYRRDADKGFSLTEDRYDQDTFVGRFKNFVDLTDPRTLFASREQIEESKRVLNEYKENGKITESHEKMWEHLKLVNATVHPILDCVIPEPFRVSAIALVNIPIVFAMTTVPASNKAVTLLLHFINQSYNTACNYSNRAGADMSVGEIAQAYSLAVASACTFALGLGKAFEYGPPVLRSMGAIIPCVASTAASVSNLTLTRSSEIANGVPVTDGEGEVRGLSQKAGASGVLQSAISRGGVFNVIVFLFPPLVMSGLRRMKMVPASKRLALFLEMGIIYGFLQTGMPAALSMYPQTMSIDVNKLEPQFRKLTDSHGRTITHLYANKGL